MRARVQLSYAVTYLGGGKGKVDRFVAEVDFKPYALGNSDGRGDTEKAAVGQFLPALFMRNNPSVGVHPCSCGRAYTHIQLGPSLGTIEPLPN